MQCIKFRCKKDSETSNGFTKGMCAAHYAQDYRKRYKEKHGGYPERNRVTQKPQGPIEVPELATRKWV